MRTIEARFPSAGLSAPALAWGVGCFVMTLLLSPNAFLFDAWDVPGLHRAFETDRTIAVPVLLLNTLFVLGVAGLVGRLWLVLLLLLPWLLWIPAEWFYLLHFGGPTSAQTFGVISETNVPEAVAWLGKTGLATLAVLCVALVFFAVMILRVRREGVRWRHWTRWLFGLVLLPLTVAAMRLMIHEPSPGEGGPEDVWGDVLDRNELGWREAFAASYPLGMFLRIRDFHAQTEMLRDISRVSYEAFGVHSQLGPRRRIFVMVVGESARADHLALNGYTKDTNPRLRQRGVMSFPDFVSATSATRSSVPYYFLPTSSEDLASRYQQPSLLDAMREAGFKTYWLSTQAPFGKFDSPISVIARRADVVKFLNPVGYRQRGYLDEVLLPAVKSAIAESPRDVFIVLHTLGSHADYRYRYPATDEYFRPVVPQEAIPDPWDPSSREQLTNAYDNALRYTDHFLDKLMGLVDAYGGDSWVFYVSDHGETLFDGQCAKSGHGFAGASNHRAAMLFWANAAYSEGHEELLAALAANRQVPSDYRAIVPTLLSLADVRSERVREGTSLASKAYQSGHRRVNTGNAWLDFDRDMMGVDCANGH